MKVRLLDPDRDAALDQAAPWNADALCQDLGLDVVLDAMADGDDYLRSVSRQVLLAPQTDCELIRYRQDVLFDCLAHPEIVRRLYRFAGEAIAGERKIVRGFLSQRPSLLLNHAVNVMSLLVTTLRQLSEFADENAAAFRSAGMTRLLRSMRDELDDAYLAEVEEHLENLRRPPRVLISAQLGRGNKGADYILRGTDDHHDSRLARMTGRGHPGISFVVPARDDAGIRAVAELGDRGRNQVADALAQATDHILDYLQHLRFEVGFYVGCANLSDALAARNLPICRPEPRPAGAREYRASALYDVGLGLRLDRVRGNDVTADGAGLVLITGANQGGKSTFLRSMGAAALMMQCGMYVAAKWFRAGVVRSIATHYKREEDATMTSGKFDEELARLSTVITRSAPSGLVLCNESFAATNEQEATEIGLEVIHALLDSGVQVFFVTHLFEMANALHQERRSDALFLRAERLPDGRRDFRVVPGEPLATSFGPDLFADVIGSRA